VGEAWQDILRTYGWAAFAFLAVLFFLYHDFWPFCKHLVERAHDERREEKMVIRRQIDKLTDMIAATESAVRATAQAVNANTHVSQKLADRVAAINVAINDLRMESLRRKKEREAERKEREHLDV
jgi:hypothetical protein